MIEYGWGNLEKTYLVLAFNGKLNSGEMRAAIEGVYELARSRKNAVSVIVDLRYAAHPPLDVLPVLVRGIKTLPRNIDQTIIINDNAMWKRLHDVIKQAYGVRIPTVHWVATVEAAYKLLPVQSSS